MIPNGIKTREMMVLQPIQLRFTREQGTRLFIVIGMRAYLRAIAGISIMLVAMIAGCTGAHSNAHRSARKADLVEILESYGPQSIDIIGLSELKEDVQDGQIQLKMFVSLLDQFGSSIKYPGTFRFEIFDYVARSPVPRGRRIESWTDIDAVNATSNNDYFRDYLKAYQFDLELKSQLQINKTYLVAVTFVTPKGKRLTNQAKIQYTP